RVQRGRRVSESSSVGWQPPPHGSRLLEASGNVASEKQQAAQRPLGAEPPHLHERRGARTLGTYRSQAAQRNRAELLHDILRLLTVFNQQRAVLLASPLLHHRDPERAAAIPGFERAILPTGLRMLAAMIESQWRVFDPTV